MADSLVDQAAAIFTDVLSHWRSQRGLTKKQLALQMGFDPSYVSHVEARRHRPTEDFARRAEAALGAGGDIWQSFRAYEAARQEQVAGQRPNRPSRDSQPGASGGGEPDAPAPTAFAAGLIVEREVATLSYVDGGYRCVVRRQLFNAGREPVTRYLIRIAVDRYPDEPERSNRFYRANPLTWHDLGLDARCAGEPMGWHIKSDRDSVKEAWLLMENDNSRFPLYPARRTDIEYSYRVSDDKWGTWFARAVRLPTRVLVVRLDFPADRAPAVWAVETSPTAGADPLRVPATEHRDGARSVFEWTVRDPMLGARLRFDWRFKDAVAPAADQATAGVAALARSAGIVQGGDPVLEHACQRFDLPAQQQLAREVVDQLHATLARWAVSKKSNADSGEWTDVADDDEPIGLSAPQLGLAWSAAVIMPPGRPSDPIVLLNPRIVTESLEQQTAAETCVSLVGENGLVARPVLIEVGYENLDGAAQVSTFTGPLARAVAHHIDHLGGLLYPDRVGGSGVDTAS